MVFRNAEESDLPQIVSLLSEIRLSADTKSGERETYPHASQEQYLSSFREIAKDSNNELVVAANEGERIVAVLQITYIPGLTLSASRRALIEGVRVAASERRSGIGKRLMLFAVSRAKARGCRLLQLTTNSWREDAIEFYNSLGFKKTHVGMRLEL